METRKSFLAFNSFYDRCFLFQFLDTETAEMPISSYLSAQAFNDLTSLWAQVGLG